jgi:hypothetical protein
MMMYTSSQHTNARSSEAPTDRAETMPTLQSSSHHWSDTSERKLEGVGVQEGEGC